MKTWNLALLALALPALPSFAQEASPSNVIYEGTCTVYIPPSATRPYKSLASVKVAFANHDSLELLRYGNVVFKVSAYNLQGTNPIVHTLSLNINKIPANENMGESSTNYQTEMPSSYLVLPNLPVLSCQASPKPDVQALLASSPLDSGTCFGDRDCVGSSHHVSKKISCSGSDMSFLPDFGGGGCEDLH